MIRRWWRCGGGGGGDGILVYRVIAVCVCVCVSASLQPLAPGGPGPPAVSNPNPLSSNPPPTSLSQLVGAELAPRRDEVVREALHHVGVAARVDRRRRDREVRVRVERDRLARVVLGHVLEDLWCLGCVCVCVCLLLVLLVIDTLM